MTAPFLLLQTLRQPMPLGFVANGRQKSGLNIRITTALTKQGAEVPFRIMEQAGPQLALGGKPEAVAAVTKVMAEGTNEAELSLGLFTQAKHHGRAIAGITGQGKEGSQGGEAALYLP
jgi:hypothetical protein